MELGNKLLSMITIIDVRENTRYVHINYDLYHYRTGKHTVRINKLRRIKVHYK